LGKAVGEMADLADDLAEQRVAQRQGKGEATGPLFR
jgi:hypothetical protein